MNIDSKEWEEIKKTEPYTDKDWANRLANTITSPYLHKIQAFGKVIFKKGKYYREKRYVYTRFIREIQDWRKEAETTVLTEVEGSKKASGLIGFQVELRNYDPVVVSEPHQWYVQEVTCEVPKLHKNILLTKSYAFQVKGTTTIVQGGFVVNDVSLGTSQKLNIVKPNFRESGSDYGWITRGKPRKATIDEVLELFNKGKLLAVFASEDWSRHGSTKVIK